MAGVNSKEIPSIDKVGEARFWEHVDRQSSPRGCWLWTGSRNTKGYGRFFYSGSLYSAHRVSWALAGREVSTDLQICHTCGTPLCVNPDHLMMANNATNQRDAKLKRNLAGKRKGVVKPHADFPLFIHQSGGGRWCKKVRGRHVYFGSIADDPKGQRALELWNEQKDDLLAGRVPRAKQEKDGLRLHDLCNRFMETKENALNSGLLSRRSYDDYHRTCKLLLKQFGKDRLVVDLLPEDFEQLRFALSKTRGPIAVGNEIRRSRILFRYAAENDLIPKPLKFGSVFKSPDKKQLRILKKKRGDRTFEAREIRRLAKAADPQMAAMVLLAINAGLGNHDVGTLPRSAIDFRGGWLNFPRPKTGIDRRAKLWPETLAAIEAAINVRPKHKHDDDADLVFITKYGGRWAKDTPDSPVSQQFRKLLDRLGLHRPGVGFYGLRHSFETVAGGSRDQVAVDLVMGHVDPSMADNYRHGIEDARLEAVVAHVRRWLFRRDSDTLWRPMRDTGSVKG